MNITSIIAILELKKIITRDEGEKIIEYFNNKPQPTLLADAVEQMKELITEDIPALMAKIDKTVKAEGKKAIDTAKKAASEIANDAVDTAEAIAKDVAEAAAKAGGKSTSEAPAENKA